MKLTKGVVEGTDLPKKGQAFLWDSEIKGFGVRLTPTGRSYIIQGRVKGGISRRVSLGKHGVITMQQARKRAKKELAKLSDGIDPIVEKKRSEAYSKTLREITSEYLRDKRKKTPPMKESSQADILKHLNKSFLDWADRPAIEITRDKVLDKFRELTARGPAQANQAFRNLRAILNYARATYRPDDKPLIVENPVAVLGQADMWNDVKPRSGLIPTKKIGKAWNVLRDLKESPGETIITHTSADAISFLLLTGARWSEMAELIWEHVNLDEKWWEVPDPKNRIPVKFPLSDIAVDILSTRPKKTTWVFPARSGDGHINDARGIFQKVSDAVGVRVTAHDMRRTFRAVAGECGIELWKAKLLMNHKLNQDVTISHYTETQDLTYLSSEINKIGNWIIRQGTIAKSEKIIQFPIRAEVTK